jgi:hypothetical protein
MNYELNMILLVFFAYFVGLFAGYFIYPDVQIIKRKFKINSQSEVKRK